MARIARIVVPGLPHHVTQRGNRRQTVFFEAGDYAFYRNILAAQCKKHGVAVWAWCLMPNHVHLILVPREATGLARAIGETHRRYTSFINSRAEQSGHLFQSRFASAVMDEDHLMAALRYVSLNPVRARLTKRARDWKWSSARAHLSGTPDGLADIRPVLSRVPDFAQFLDEDAGEAANAAIRKAETTGRPVGSLPFMKKLEARLGRRLVPGKRGPKPKT